MNDALRIRREDTGSKGRSVASLDGHEAEITWSRVNKGLIIVDHTGVPDALRGRGIGEALVRDLVEHAREAGFKLIPLCPYAKAQISRHPEWQDVVN